MVRLPVAVALVSSSHDLQKHLLLENNFLLRPNQASLYYCKELELVLGHIPKPLIKIRQGTHDEGNLFCGWFLSISYFV